MTQESCQIVQDLEISLKAFQAACIKHMDDAQSVPRLLCDWQALATEIELLRKTGCLTESARALARIVASNVLVITQGVVALQREADVEADDLAARLEHLTMSTRACDQPSSSWAPKRKIRPTVDDSSPPRTRRPRFSSTDCSSPGPSFISSPGSSSSSASLTGIAILRQWFLDNLAVPFLPASEFKTMSERTTLSTKQINGHLINWRRRSGWTTFRETYANKSRDGASFLLERLLDLERGREVSCEVDGKSLLHLGIWDRVPQELRKNIKGTRTRKLDLGGRLKLGYPSQVEDDMLRHLSEIRKYMSKQDGEVGQWIKKVLDAVPSSAPVAEVPENATTPPFFSTVSTRLVPPRSSAQSYPRSFSTSSTTSSVSDISERLRSVSGSSDSSPDRPKVFNWLHCTPASFTFGQDSKHNKFTPDLPLLDNGVASWEEFI